MQKLFENWQKFLNENKNNFMSLYDDLGNRNFIIGGPFGFDASGTGKSRIGYIVSPTPEGLKYAESLGLNIPKGTTAIYYSTGTGGGSKAGELVSFGGMAEVPSSAKEMGYYVMKEPSPIGQLKKANPFAFSEDLLKKLNGTNVAVGPVPKPKNVFKGTKNINTILKRFGAFKPEWIDEAPKLDFKIKLGAIHGFETAEELNKKHKFWKMIFPDITFANTGVTKRSQDLARARAIDKQIENLRNPQVQKAVKSVEENIPKKEGAWRKFARKIPGLKYLFIGGIAASIVSQADDAYASDGLPGALKVYAKAGIDLTPILGDALGILDIGKALDDAKTRRAQRFVKDMETGGRGATSIKMPPKEMSDNEKMARAFSMGGRR